MIKKTKTILFLWTALCMMGQTPSYATHPCEESGNTLKRKAGAPSLGEMPQKKRRFKEDWLDLLSEQYLSPSDYEEYDLEDEDLQSAPMTPFDDQAIEALADLYRYFPQDLFNGILLSALADHKEGCLTPKAYRTLMSWTMVSKDYYERITGYPFSDMLTHWKNTRMHSSTVLNHFGLEISSFLSDEQRNIDTYRQSIFSKWQRKQQEEIYTSGGVPVLAPLMGEYREGYDNETSLYEEKRRNITGQIKCIDEQTAKYYLEGTKVQKLPRYVIEAVKHLSIPFNKLFVKAFVNKGEGRFLSIAKRLEGTGIEKVKIKVDKKKYDKELLQDTSLGIVQLMTHLPTQVSEMDLSELLLTSSMMERFATLSNKCPLKKVRLSTNPYHDIKKEIWKKFAKGIQSSKVEEIDLVQYYGRDHYELRFNTSGNIRTIWLHNFLSALLKKDTPVPRQSEPSGIALKACCHRAIIKCLSKKRYGNHRECLKKNIS